jgi:hypothetical protein
MFKQLKWQVPRFGLTVSAISGVFMLPMSLLRRGLDRKLNLK